MIRNLNQNRWGAPSSGRLASNVVLKMKCVCAAIMAVALLGITTGCIGGDTLESDDVVSHLIEKLGTLNAGGHIVLRRGALKWDPNAQGVELPARWRTAEVIVQWKDEGWRNWLDNQGIKQPEYAGDRAGLSEIDALLLNTYSHSISDKRFGTVVIQVTEIGPPAKHRLRITLSQPISPFLAIKQALAEQGADHRTPSDPGPSAGREPRG